MLRQIQWSIPTHRTVFECLELLHSLKVLFQIAQKLCLSTYSTKPRNNYKLSAYERFCFGKSYFSWPNTRSCRETLDFHVEYVGVLDGNKLRKSSHILAPSLCLIWKVFQSCLTSQRLKLHFMMFCLQTCYWKLGRENIIHDSIRSTEYSRQIVEERRSERGYT